MSKLKLKRKLKSVVMKKKQIEREHLKKASMSLCQNLATTCQPTEVLLDLDLVSSKDVGNTFQILQVSIVNFSGVHFKFCRCPFQILQVSILNLAGVHFKFCRCLFQILQVSISNFAGVHFKFCRCPFQIFQVSISNFAGVHFKFCRCPFQKKASISNFAGA
jgi:hypothetical protein